MRRTIPSSALSTAEPVAWTPAGGGGAAAARQPAPGVDVTGIHGAIAACPRAGVAGIHCPVLPRLAWDVAPRLDRGAAAEAADMAVTAARTGLDCSADCAAAAPVADLAQAALAAAREQAEG
ncbi:hypothetical protein C882_2528 [Caenispirillum salinarum AK4]|uniref:Uncharacterized protein n=1 Tax=Caenispirillum salinarum AK4 TaxID=1238182 RepID=K9H5R4_9PROT|nr:hypothetical protein [Caenispirillum salinarum]EKV32449.1 hypothetical protein C882_2528 [Caenispirillum salinarum AK4]